MAIAAGPDDSPVLVRDVARGPSGSLAVTVPWAPAVVSVEALAVEAGLAGRARYGLPIAGAARARPALSDLLLVDPTEPFPRSLEEAIPRARGTTRVDPEAPIGVYWELYPPGGGPYEVRWSLRLRDDRGGFWRGLGAALGLAGPVGGSTALEWIEAVPTGLAIAPRALALTLPNLPAGTYALELKAVLPDSRRARVERRIVVE
jgi:hypothetical protein